MKNVFNPLRGKLFPLVLASIVLLLNTTHVFQAEDIIPYNSPYIVDTVNYKNEKIQPNTTAMHHGSNKSTLFALNKQSMSVIYKSLTAIIGIFAMSLMIVSCMRYLNKNKYRQLQSRRLAGNGTDGCNTEGNGDDKDQGAAANASDEDTDDDDDSDGDIDPELLKDEDHDIPYNEMEEEIIESINYLQGVSAGESAIKSVEELKEQLKKETKEYEAEMVQKAEALYKDPTSDFQEEGYTIAEVIEWQKDLTWTGVQTITYGSDPTLLKSALGQCTRVLTIAMESGMGGYVKELHDFLSNLNGEETSEGFQSEAVAEEIQKLKQKEGLTEVERALLHINDALLPNLVEQNNNNANEYAVLQKGLKRLAQSEELLLKEYIEFKSKPLYSDKSDSEEEAEEGAAADTAK